MDLRRCGSIGMPKMEGFGFYRTLEMAGGSWSSLGAGGTVFQCSQRAASAGGDLQKLAHTMLLDGRCSQGLSQTWVLKG